MIENLNSNTVDIYPVSHKQQQVLELCEHAKNLITAIYLIEQEKFIYYHDQLEPITGRCCHNLLSQHWDFWFSILDPAESLLVKNKILGFLQPPYSQRSLLLHYHIRGLKEQRPLIKHEIRLYELEQEKIAINYFYDLSDKERIEKCFETTEFSKGTKKGQPFHISQREREVLCLIANGFSSKEIANMLFISNHTAISHRKNLIEKFNVKNTAHLIKKAASFIGV